MKKIPLSRLSQVFPIIKTLDLIGSPTEKLLKQVHLPIYCHEKPHSLVPEYAIWFLFEKAAHLEGIEDFGLLVAEKTKIEDIGVFGQLLLQPPTLSEIINQLLERVNWHNSDASFWFKLESQNVWFYRKGIVGIDVGCDQVELYTVMLMIQMVQLVTDANWFPRQIYLQMGKRKHLNHHHLLGQSELYFNQPFTAIVFPRYLLSLTRKQQIIT